MATAAATRRPGTRTSRRTHARAIMGGMSEMITMVGVLVSVLGLCVLCACRTPDGSDARMRRGRLTGLGAYLAGVAVIMTTHRLASVTYGFELLMSVMLLIAVSVGAMIYIVVGRYA